MNGKGESIRDLKWKYYILTWPTGEDFEFFGGVAFDQKKIQQHLQLIVGQKAPRADFAARKTESYSRTGISLVERRFRR